MTNDQDTKDIIRRVVDLEAQVSLLMRTIVTQQPQKIEETKEQDNEFPFTTFTPKQHCTLQMLLNGRSNKEISERFGVTVDTAKVHVRTVAKKLGVNSRSQIVAKALAPMNKMDDNQYRIFTGGLPKNWDAEYEEPDPFAGIYTKGGEE